MQFNLDYFHGNEAGPSRFYRMPKALFDGNLSLEAATLYSLMLDRVGLSVKNGWTDGLGRIFIYFVQKDVQKFLRCGHNRATAFVRELERFGLIERKRQGLGKPAMIYVKNFFGCGNNVAPQNETNEAVEPSRNEKKVSAVQREESSNKALFSAPGVPAANQRSVCGGERRKEWSGRSPRREAGTKQSGISSDDKAARTGQSRVPAEGSLDCPNRAANETEKKETELTETNRILPKPLAVANSASLASPQAAKLTRCAAPALSTANASLVCGGGPKGRNLMDEMRWVREEIRENIDYEGLVWDHPCDADIFDGYVELMTEAACSTRETVRICGQELPTAVVRSRFLKLGREHVEYVRDCLGHTTAAIGNIKAYTLAALYNAPATMGQYYASLVSRDLAEDSTDSIRARSAAPCLPMIV